MGNFIQSDMGFLTKSPSPLDGKQEFATILEMKNFDTSWLGNTAMATCDEDGKLYVYNVNNTENDTTGKWRVVATGGEGGASTADAVEYINDTISSTNVEEALNKLISDYYYVKPSINSFTATPNGGIFEVGHVVSAPITFNWSYNKDITTQTLTDCTLADETVRTATYAGDITTNKTFTLTASNGKNNVSSSISYSFVNPMYTAYINKDIDTTTITEDMITGGAKLLKKKNTFTFTTNKIVLDIEKFCFAYDSSYGVLSSIKDVNNGFECINAFNRIEMDITTADGTIIKYYVYLMKSDEILEDSDNFKYQIKW